MVDRETIEVTIGPKGRLVLPAALRRRLNMEPGTVVCARAEGDRLVLEPREAVLRRVRERFAGIPATISLSEELIAERRREASLEAES